MMQRKLSLIFFFLLGIIPPGLQAAIPDTLNYQGRLRSAGTGLPVADSTGNSVIFRICSDAACATPLWTENWNGPNYVSTSSGLFNVVLGSLNPMTNPPLAFDQQYWLEIQWHNGATYETMLPRQPLTASPYAFRARAVDAPISLTSTGTDTTIYSENTGAGTAVYARANSTGEALRVQQTGGGAGVSSTVITVSATNSAALYGFRGGAGGHSGFGVKGAVGPTTVVGGAAIYGINYSSNAGSMGLLVESASNIGISVTASGGASSALVARNNSTASTAEFINDGAGSPLKVNALRFPSGAGSSGQVLSTDGASQMNWINAPAPAAPLSLTFNAGNLASPIYGSNSIAGGVALYGSGTGGAHGVFGLSNNINGAGVLAQNMAGGESLRVLGRAKIVDPISAPNSLLAVSQTASTGGGYAVYALNLASATAAVYGVSGDSTVPGPGNFPGLGVHGLGPIGVLGMTKLVDGIGVMGSVSTNAAGGGVFGFNSGSGDGVSGESLWGTGVKGDGVTGTAGFATAPGGVGVLASDSGMGGPSLGLRVFGAAEISGNRHPTGAGSPGQVLTTNGAGQLNWANAPSPAAPMSLTATSVVPALHLYSNFGAALSVSHSGGGPGSTFVSLNNDAVYSETWGNGAFSGMRGRARGGNAYYGVRGDTEFPSGRAGVFGAAGSGFPVGVPGMAGVVGSADAVAGGLGVYGSGQAYGVVAQSGAIALSATSQAAQAVYARSNFSGGPVVEVVNDGTPGIGVQATSFGNGSPAVYGNNSSIGGWGVRGRGDNGGKGVVAEGGAVGLSATANTGTAVYGRNNNVGPTAEFVNDGGGSPLKVNALSFPFNTGTSGQVLTTNGSNQMNWSNVPPPSAPLLLSGALGGPIIQGNNTANGPGLEGISATGPGVNATGVTGVYATGTSYGVYGDGGTSYGIFGRTNSSGLSVGGANGQNFGSGPGVYGTANTGVGVFGVSTSGEGVRGESNSGMAALRGVNLNVGYGVHGSSNSSIGVYGTGSANHGIQGETFANSFAGVIGVDSSSSGGVGVWAISAPAGGIGLRAQNNAGGTGILAQVTGGIGNGTAILAQGQGIGVSATATSGAAIYGAAPVVALDTLGAWQNRGMPSPPVSPAGQGRIYFDATANKFKVSENGVGYVDLVGSPGLGGSGTPNQIAVFTGGTTLGSSFNLNWDGANSRLGVGVFPGAGYRMSVEGGTAPAATMTANAISVLQLRNYNVAPGASYGLNAVVDSGNGGRAVYGSATVGISTTYGIYGDANNSAGRGVYGQGYIGVEGRSTAAAGSAGVWGAHQTLGAYGVYGQHDTSGGVAIFGNAPFGAGSSIGVQGVSNGTAGSGVVGSGFYGVRGNSSSVGGAGLLGYANTSGAYAAIISHTAGANAVALSVTSQAVPGAAIYAGGSVALDADGIVEWRGKTGAALPPAGRARIYYDSVLGKFRASEGGAYVDLMGGSGVTAPLSLTSTSADTTLFLENTNTIGGGLFVSNTASVSPIRSNSYGSAPGVSGENFGSGIGVYGNSAAGVGIQGRSGMTGQPGIIAENNSFSGGVGLLAQLSGGGGGGTAVRARGQALGISATASDAGGVAGHFQGDAALIATGNNVGVSATVKNPGVAVMGIALANNSAGVYGSSSQFQGSGVFGINEATGAGGGTGVYAEAKSQNGQSVDAFQSNATSNGTAVNARVASNNAYAVRATGGFMGVSATASNGGGRAYFGHVNSTAPAAEFLNDQGASTPLKLNSYRFPSGGGASGEVLTSDGLGQLYWAAGGGFSPPAAWSLPAAFPLGLLTSTNTGNGHGFAGYATQPGQVLSNPDMNSQFSAGLMGYTGVSLSAGVLGRSADTTGFGAGVMGQGYRGVMGLADPNLAGSRGGQLESSAVNGRGLFARADVGGMAIEANGTTAGAFYGNALGITVTASSGTALIARSYSFVSPSAELINQNGGLALKTDGDAFLMGRVTVTGSTADMSGGTFRAYNGSGTSWAISAHNQPGAALLAAGGSRGISATASTGTGVYAAGSQLALAADGAIEQYGTSDPGTAPGNRGRIYFDGVTKRFRVSQDGGPWVDMLGGGVSAPLTLVNGDPRPTILGVNSSNGAGLAAQGSMFGITATAYFTMTGASAVALQLTATTTNTAPAFAIVADAVGQIDQSTVLLGNASGQGTSRGISVSARSFFNDAHGIWASANGSTVSQAIYGVIGNTAIVPFAGAAAVIGEGRNAGDGVVGRTEASTYSGVYGRYLGGSGYGYGVYGQTSASDLNRNIGVFGTYGGLSSPISNLVNGAGVVGANEQAEGWGVYGLANSGLGFVQYGVVGEAAGSGGVGVWGRAAGGRGGAFDGRFLGISATASDATSGVGAVIQSANVGVSAEGFGVGVSATANDTAAGVGVWGRINGYGANASGVIGQVSGFSSATNIPRGGVVAVNSTVSTTNGSPAVALYIDGAIAANTGRVDRSVGNNVSVLLNTPAGTGPTVRWAQVIINSQSIKANSIVLLTPSIGTALYGNAVVVTARLAALALGQATVLVTAVQAGGGDPGAQTVNLNYMIINQ